MLNSTLLSSASKVIASPTPSTYFINVRFINEKADSKFSFVPLFLDDIIINRDYADKFADEFDLSMTISPKDYALLQDQGQNLIAIITISYSDKGGTVVYNPTPIQKQYKVIINDPQDVRKTVPDIHMYTEPSVKMSVRLVESTVYDLRHTKVNAIYQTMTVKDVIYAITHEFGIKRIHLVEPDNTHEYDHIDVGSYQGIDSVYGYLQSTCGIYTRGINSYIQDGCIYIYPPFDTDPKYDKTTLFYQVDRGRFAGSDYFHKITNNSLSIVVNSQPTITDLSIVGAENIGTGFIFNRASRLADGFTAIDDTDGAKFTDNPSISVTLNNSRTVTESRNNLFHVHATDNPFPYMSELASHQASVASVIWMNADPFQMDPCQRLIYYYDKEGSMIQKTGILEKALYKFSRIKKIDKRDIYGCVGSLTLRLSPNETVVL